MAAFSNIATKSSYSLLTAAAVAAGPKSVGAFFRIGDDSKAPWDVEKETIKRELATVGQVSLYGVAIERAVGGLTRIAERMTVHGESNLFSTALQKLQGNHALFLIGLSCTANVVAETVSRKLAPRNIWKEKPSMDVVLVPEKGDQPLSPAPRCLTLRFEKAEPLFQARKPLPVPFASRGNAPVAPTPNPFQVGRALPPVARPAFSV
jgi:hypothetical protein